LDRERRVRSRGAVVERGPAENVINRSSVAALPLERMAVITAERFCRVKMSAMIRARVARFSGAGVKRVLR
jgi:hypothetical protein